MTINFKRLDEFLWLLQQALDISDDYQLKGIPVKTWLTPIRQDLIKAIKQNPDKTEALFEFIVDGIFYVREDSDDCPRIEQEWKLE